MSDIWHTPPQTPDVFKSHPIIVIYEAGDEIEQMDSTEYSDLVGERYVNRWCYVDDLIKENERTRRVLEIAVDALKSAHNYYEYCLQSEDIGSDDTNWDCTAMNMDDDINEALEQITALEQKDK